MSEAKRPSGEGGVWGSYVAYLKELEKKLEAVRRAIDIHNASSSDYDSGLTEAETIGFITGIVYPLNQQEDTE